MNTLYNNIYCIIISTIMKALLSYFTDEHKLKTSNITDEVEPSTYKKCADIAIANQDTVYYFTRNVKNEIIFKAVLATNKANVFLLYKDNYCVTEINSFDDSKMSAANKADIGLIFKDNLKCQICQTDNNKVFLCESKACVVCWQCIKDHLLSHSEAQLASHGGIIQCPVCRNKLKDAKNFVLIKSSDYYK